MKENWRMSTCNRLDLQTLGSQPIMPKNLPDHWSRRSCVIENIDITWRSRVIEITDVTWRPHVIEFIDITWLMGQCLARVDIPLNVFLTLSHKNYKGGCFSLSLSTRRKQASFAHEKDSVLTLLSD